MSSAYSSLDSILVELGEFGRYQSFVFGLVCFAVVLHSAVHIAFVFTAKDLEYRCEVPGCDTENGPFNPSWLQNAVPYAKSVPEKCLRYPPFSNETYGNCSAENFDQNDVIRCDKFVYKEPEVTIVNDFGLHCNENLWKLTLIGTINNVGQFVGLPVSGIISDKYGRRLVLVMGMVLTAIAGVAKSFAPNYEWFSVFEFLDAAFGSGTYACGFILGVELVGPEKRVLSGTIICSCYAVGEVIVAALAWKLRSWRPLVQIVYLPALLLLSYFWITPESIRWNLTKGRIEEAQTILRKAATINGKTLSEHTLEKLVLQDPKEKDQYKYQLKDIFKSVPLLLRFLNCCFCWITCTFLFYGLTLNSVALAGNPYLDFILTALIEIPAYFCCYFIVDTLGRKASQCLSFVLTGIACFAFIFVPQDSEWGQLCVYLLGKFGATAAFTIIYVITSEIFPTSQRQSIMGICSMFGRIGSMISPQTPLLAQVWEPLPLVLFGGMSSVAGFLSLLFPETLKKKLPDTIEEAVHIGKNLENIENSKVRLS